MIPRSSKSERAGEISPILPMVIRRYRSCEATFESWVWNSTNRVGQSSSTEVQMATLGVRWVKTVPGVPKHQWGSYLPPITPTL